MSRLMRPALLLTLVALTTLPALADKAKDLYAKGQDAEARQQYEAAYDLFKQAYELKPKDLRYRAAFEHIRFEAAATITHRGQKLRDDGKLDEAVAEFQKALAIDPSLFIAQQELTRTLKMINDKQNPQPQAAGPPEGLKKRVHEAAGPVELAPISNTPIAVKFANEKSDTVYRTIGQLAGINVLFDPDYTPRPIRVELNGVTLEDALEIVALESKTFWRPVTANTIFVATDNPAKRKELEQSVLKTFYLSNLSQPTELQDVVNAIRAVLDVQRVQQLLSQNALVVRGTPDQIALAEKLVEDLDKARPEVIVDIAVMQVSKDKSRTLGFNPPTSATVTLQSNISTATTTGTTTTTTGTTGTTGTTANGINLNTLGNLNATDFQVVIPSANLSALMNNSDTKLIQNPQIRALDGQKASLKIGDRVPVATGSFQPGIGGVGINPLVNTQFQYLDVGVNIDITPRVHANGEVTLKIAMDVSAVTGQQNIGGISQPIIGQRKIEHEIRLKDGEANLLGGIMEDQQTKSLAGIPGLAQIPILKYLFGQTTQDHSENQIVFAIVPHIIRGTDVTAENQRAIDIGTSTAIELHRKPQPPATAAPAGQSSAPAPSNQTPAAHPAGPAGNGSAAPAASFLFDPPTVQATKGNTFAVNLLISGAQNVYSVPVQLNYDPKLLQLVNVSNGGFLSQDGQAVGLVHREDEALGQAQITATRPPGSGGVSGQGAIVTMTFMAKADGQTPLTITRGGARDPGLQAITVNGAQAAVTIQ
ncbi:MAG TPA: cohesin domain-containing protein [Candidatus Sulfotelmatobacter sp.]|jgi:general secretion pathway protein D|nr:cohesin domain-containing protein [Candidatus Sulfotelmatobacter sp.]